MRPKPLVPALLLALVTGPAWGSARSDAVRRLIDEGRPDTASAKCDRLGAELSDAGKDLREVCAEAKFTEAMEVNQVMEWIRFQQVWKGTAFAAAARDNEAAAALRDLGPNAAEHEYVSFMREYKDTKFAMAANQMVADAAIRDVKTGKEAVRVAQLYPNHKSTPLLVEKFLSSFLKMEMDGTNVKVTLDPPIPIPGPPPTGRWAVRTGEDAYQPWGDAAQLHLKELGVGPAFIDAAGAKGYPPCQVPGVDWELGVLVEVGSGRAFYPNTGISACRGRAWPGFAVYDGGRLAALSVTPASVLRFPTDPGAGSFAWGPSGDQTQIWTPGQAGDPILVGNVIGQPVGNLFLLTPLAGGMPWYVSQGPPPTAMHLPVEAKSAALPEGWQLSDSNGPIQAGRTTTTPVDVGSSALAGTPWTLPPGEIRVLSPLVQQITNLHRKNEMFERVRKPKLPALTGTTGPMGALPVVMTELTQPAAQAVGRQLGGVGIPVTIWRAWEGFIAGTSGGREVVFDGEIAGKPVKGLLDPMDNSSGYRAFIWLRDPRSQTGPEEVFAFSHDGSTYFVWRGKGEKGDYTESIHFEDVGMVREFR